jgi:hypothetical protein
MIISPNGNDPDRVKLLDFGIARMINEGATRGLTREGEVFGTPHYMAPEQAQGKKSIGPPADIYAVGIMIWEMICGYCPYDAPTPLAVLFMHINDPLPEMQPQPGVEVPPELLALVERATAKEPEARFQTASEMLSELHSVIATATGMHPGAFTGDLSHEFTLEDLTGSGTHSMFDASRTPQHTPVPTQPHFTPSTGEMAAGVNVLDPDPSAVTDLETPETMPPGQSKKLGIAAIVSVAAVGLVVLALALVVMSDDEPQVDDSVAEATEKSDDSTETTEVAVTNKQPDEIEVEQLEPIKNEETTPSQEDATAKADADQAEKNTDLAAQANADRVADDDPAEEEAKPKEEPKPKPKPKPRRKRKTRKRKPKPKAEPKEDDTSKKAAPALWKPKAKRWDR